ncbi:uncharacterized protein GIQ15_05300 [Arthroderma uncinatum]|uniref:uncharacterized protein n=1 Tax=Arthroderma uncinatum TaxID=74035 RepID=UPI00144AF305|nr:uncharacterized protein GIQ15_05300 [Arthroderma uncinatum]KAF3482541.1 hypothetical protein GIQ15_05300 [Arthroderma uncinatum]
MDPPRTISEIKLGFLRDQVRVLSTPLDPSPDWREYGPIVEDDISDKVVNEVLQKCNLRLPLLYTMLAPNVILCLSCMSWTGLTGSNAVNTLLKQHSRTVFSTQAIHHVSQQIERLYWNSISPELGEESTQLVIDKGVDLTNTRNIARLPDEWHEDGMSEEDKARYDLLRGRLIKLDAERKKREDRLLQYKRLKRLLEPFEDPMNTIQPNLATRDGQLGAELDRMRMLLAKVASKVGRAQNLNSTSEQETEPVMDAEEKLARLLDMT